MPAATKDIASRLASIVEASRIRIEPAALAEYAIDEMAPRAVAAPQSAAEAAEIVRFAIAEDLAVIAVGSRSKLGIGMAPSRYDIALDMTAINQIAHYDPGDLTLSADAGCTLATISGALLPQKQFLPLSLAHGVHNTIAGTIASGVDSHLRQFYGTARDFMVGAEFIDGTGANCKSGGRVVKNVTGYDLHKLLIGSLGTLAVITRLNFRTFSSLTSGESQETFVASFSDAQSAVALRQGIAASPFTPHAVEIVSPELSKIFAAIDPSEWEPPGEPLGAWFSSSCWHVVVLFQGTPELRSRYTTALTQLAESAGALVSRNLRAPTLDRQSGNSSEGYTLNVLVFGAIRRLRNASPAATIFKIAQLPAKLPELFDALATAAKRANLPHALFARGMGVVYFALLPKSHGEVAMAQLTQTAASIFALCGAQAATVSIQSCPTALKRVIPVLGTARPDALAMRRLKAAFDPRGIFAPGRLF
jgi:glycolate oxidase FAD binding subunit